MRNSPGPTGVGNAILQATGILRDAGIESPRLDAELLMAFLLACDRLKLVVDSSRHLTEKELADFFALVEVRSRRTPLPYLTGERDFYGLSFRITPGVLVPRPETEGLVESVLGELVGRDCARVLDIGSGSGCVAVALARALPSAEVVAVDRDPVAVALSRENAERLGVSNRVQVLSLDFPTEIDRIRGRFDALVSNPPYIPAGEIDSLQPEVSRFEPRAALDGGPDGLDFIRELIARARNLLRPAGVLVMEIGIGEADAVVALGRVAGFQRTRVFPDLAGIPRVVLMGVETRVLGVDEAAISEAVSALRRGEPVAFPTETVYGLGARGTDAAGIGRIYEAKGRDEGKPIALLISSPAQAEGLVRELPSAARRLMEEYCPGPLTIVLEAGERVPEAVTAGTGKVGIRMPDHAAARALIEAVGEPLAATSANRSGGPEPGSAGDVLNQLDGRVVILLDGGPVPGGVPSTVVDLTESPARILREGAISAEEIRKSLSNTERLT